MGAQPGWYPDPAGCWDERWWDGSVWTDDVRTGLHQDRDAYPPAPPADRGAAILDLTSQRLGPGAERYRLLWSELHIHRKANAPPSEVIPLWGIASIEVRTGVVAHSLGQADIAVNVAYPGYYGPTTFVMLTMAQPHWVKAMIRRQIGICSSYR